MSSIAIGHLHGNAAALGDLLEQFAGQLSAQDIVVFPGDYVDRGADSRGCIQMWHRRWVAPTCPFPPVLRQLVNTSIPVHSGHRLQDPTALKDRGFNGQGALKDRHRITPQLRTCTASSVVPSVGGTELRPVGGWHNSVYAGTCGITRYRFIGQALY